MWIFSKCGFKKKLEYLRWVKDEGRVMVVLLMMTPSTGDDLTTSAISRMSASVKSGAILSTIFGFRE